MCASIHMIVVNNTKKRKLQYISLAVSLAHDVSGVINT